MQPDRDFWSVLRQAYHYAVAVTLSYAVADSDKVNLKKICVVIERLDTLFFVLPSNVATASYSAVQILHGSRHHMMQATEHTWNTSEYITHFSYKVSVHKQLLQCAMYILFT